MKLVKILMTLLLSSSYYSCANGKDCNSSDCLNETNGIVVSSARVAGNNVCFLCHGEDCFDPAGSNAAEVECESPCYIGIDESGQTIRGCASEYDTKECSQDENSISQCLTCIGDYCNAILYPVNGRLQCHTCLDEFCEPSQDATQYCTRYRADEKCVTIYSPEVDVVELRGCISDVDSLNECVKSSDNCLTCSTDNCNNDNSRAEIYSCIGCNSIDDPSCLSSSVALTTRCASDTCYTRLTSDSGGRQMVERGCLADLTQQCSGTDCVSCTGTNCNNKIFPENRISCKFCTGDSCLDSVQDKICSNYFDNNACITYFGSGNKVIYKDCYDDIPTATKEICSDYNNIDCTKCSGTLCNKDLYRRGNKCFQCSGIDCFRPTLGDIVDCVSDCFIGTDTDGYTVRGCAENIPSSVSDILTCTGDSCNAIIHPVQDRLQCHTCQDASCLPTADDVQYCSKYGMDEKCVTIYSADEDKVIARGCMSEVYQQDECKNNGSNCLTCTTNRCNNDISKTQIYSCIGCTSTDDPDCLGNGKELTKKCATDMCYTYLYANSDGKQILERGCAVDLVQCNGTNFQTCCGSNCNSQIFPEDRMSCKFCIGSDCSSHLIPDKICHNYVDNDACITFYGSDNEVIYRDCYDDVPTETQNVCSESNNIQCTKCSGSLCNTDTKRRGNKCFQCAGIDCFHPVLADTVDCLSDCFVGVNQYGETVRGCADKVDTTTLCLNGTCLKCSDDLCNGVAYPVTNRLSCLSCTNGDCVNIDASKYCEVYGQLETCVTVFDSLNQVTERGCLSTLSRAEYCKSNQASCVQCQFDNCNVQTALDQKTNCIDCNSAFDMTCVTNPMTSMTVGCTSKCYTRFVPNDGENIERGCSDSLTTTCTSGDCAECAGDRCNSQIFPANRLSCYKCIGSECDVEDVEMKKEACVAYKANNTCVTVFDNDAKVILKGCHSDVTTDTQALCDDSSDISCTKCTGNNCNNIRKRRGTKCMQCSGLDCLTPGYPANTVSCPTGGCYVGIDANGITQKGCATNYQNSSTCALNVDTEVSKTCLVCDNDFCNAIVYPLENRLICMSCYGDQCNDVSIEEKYCEKYHPSEQCVSIFNDADKVIERGCSSTIEKSAVCSQNSTSCLKCQSNRCNTQASSAEKYNCVSCDSKTDPTCTSSTSNPNVKSCTTNQCYSRLIPISGSLSWQYVEKGCSSDLTSCNNCTVCDGTLCNNVVYPSNIISCRHCIGDECKVSATTKYCSLFNREKQACITVYAGRQDVIYRGCYSDAASGTQELCDDTTSIACTKCSSSGNCNSDTTRRGYKCYKCQGLECFKPVHPADVVDCTSDCYVGLNSHGENVRGCKASYSDQTCGRKEDGQHECIACQDDHCNGIIYPVTERLSCHTCHGIDNCQQATNDNVDLCPLYGSNERCVSVFDGNNTVVERGCSSILNNKNYCTINDKNCLECSTNGCNDATSVDMKICAICDSSTDPDCVLDPKSVPAKYCEQGCYTRLVNGHTKRGCLEDLDTAQCEAAHDCFACASSDKCNVINYPNNRMECFTCSNSTDCVRPSIKPCIRHKDGDTCVTIFNEYNVARKGCHADQSASDQASCSANSNTCLSCPQKNCNTINVRPDEKCIQCKSDINPDCAQRPQVLTADSCLLPSDGECFARISGGATVRGCKGSLLPTDVGKCRNNSISSECQISRGQSSNNILVPLMRLNCYHCDSSKDKTCTEKQTDNQLLLPCKTFQKPENCVKISYSDGRVVRGCLADFGTDACSNGQCQTCPSNQIKDGCNFNFAVKMSASVVSLALLMLGLLLLK